MEADLRAVPQGSAEGIVEGTDPLRQGDDVDVIKEGEDGLAVAELTLQVREHVVLRQWLFLGTLTLQLLFAGGNAGSRVAKGLQP